MSITIEQFVERLTESGLMSACEIDAFQQQLPPERKAKDAQQLAQALVQHGKLTEYQAEAVCQGKNQGLVFGEYTVLDQIGEGGMGVVLKAQHRRMKRLVAIKVLSSAAMKVAGAIERFHREVEAAAKLIHPNIVTAFDAAEHQGMHYLAMEYVEGQDLATVVKEHGPLPVRQAVECVLQAARGLQYAHAKGIIHRDIKPGNLLLDKEGTVKILDMGLARLAGTEAALGGAERLTTTGQVMGTCDYMAPEQSLDTHQADARADIYSLGCTLYRLLTGNPPYQGETFAKLFLMHLEAPIPSLREARPETPEALDAVFQRMLAKRPEDRYQSMAEVAAELEAVLVVLSGRSPAAAAAGAESSSAAFSKTLAFLHENTPHGTLTRQRQSTAEAHTRPHLGAEHDTGPSVVAKARGAVGGLRRKPLVLTALAGGPVLLLGIILAITLPRGTRSPGVPATPPPLAVAPFNAEQAKEHQEAWAKYLGVPVEMTNAIGMKLVLIPPGEFTMGERGDTHKVKITTPFYLGKYEVTQEEWQAVMGTNPSEVKGPKNPVEKVSWENCQVFLKKLGEKCGVSEGCYRLPTEAQWEYACRAGSTGGHSFGDSPGLIDDHAWHDKNSDRTTHPVGQKKANAWGLYDVHGNVREWCSDWLDEGYYSISPLSDPLGPASGAKHVYRGGSVIDGWGCRSATRGGREPGFRDGLLGLRVCLALRDKVGGELPLARQTSAAGNQARMDLPARPSSLFGPKGNWKLPSGAPPPVIAPFDAAKAKEHQEAWAKYLGLPVEMTNSIGMKLVLIPPGEFTMGEGKEAHKVRITKPFYLGKYEVTQEQWEAVMGNRPSQFQGPKNPVDGVSWNDCQDLLRKLNEKSEIPQESYRLPTEAQWEYACRAGSIGKWAFGDNESRLDEYGWYDGNSEKTTHPVGEKKPNAWGLHDMHGNLWEWCADWFDKGYYSVSSLSDPIGPSSGSRRVIRGGGWNRNARNTWSESRDSEEPWKGGGIWGVRVSLVLPDKPPPGSSSPSPFVGPDGNWKLPPGAPPPAVAPFDGAKAKEHQEAWAKYLGVPVEMTNSIGLKLVLIPPGEFTMGEGNGAHKVRITEPFYLGKYEVTQEEWEAVMGKNGSKSQFKGPRNPVDKVSWEDCQVFLKKLGERCGDAKGSYQLPTEAQWEYSCRAGTTGNYCFGSVDAELGEYGWYGENSERRSHPPGEKKPNAWGLYDMHGNVWEWCADWYDEGYYKAAPGIDPTGPASGSQRVQRGGSLGNAAGECRSTSHAHREPGSHGDFLGLRVSLVLPDKLRAGSDNSLHVGPKDGQ